MIHSIVGSPVALSYQEVFSLKKGLNKFKQMQYELPCVKGTDDSDKNDAKQGKANVCNRVDSIRIPLEEAWGKFHQHFISIYMSRSKL